MKKNPFNFILDQMGRLFSYKSPKPFQNELDPRFLRFHTNKTLMKIAKTKSHLSKKQLIEIIKSIS
tara:strand:- start:86 stop:283 length:198 start_codon:yes stop_codon:yes gene_type:complete